MTGTPKLYVDFNLRDPAHPDRLFASLRRLGDRRLGDHVRVTDHEQFEMDATIVALDHSRGEVVLQVQPAAVAIPPKDPVPTLFALSGEAKDHPGRAGSIDAQDVVTFEPFGGQILVDSSG